MTSEKVPVIAVVVDTHSSTITFHTLQTITIILEESDRTSLKIKKKKIQCTMQN